MRECAWKCKQACGVPAFYGGGTHACFGARGFFSSPQIWPVRRLHACACACALACGQGQAWARVDVTACGGDLAGHSQSVESDRKLLSA